MGGFLPLPPKPFVIHENLINISYYKVPIFGSVIFHQNLGQTGFSHYTTNILVLQRECMEGNLLNLTYSLLSVCHLYVFLRQPHTFHVTE